MASRSLNDLTPRMKEKALHVQLDCKKSGVELLIYCTLRSLEEQAIAYRQSRPYPVIAKKMLKLKMDGYGYLADIIEKVGPQSGPHVTNAAPGESWHNYKMAIDAVPVKNGKLLWEDDAPEWEVYGNVVKMNSLTWAGSWRGWNEKPHAQLMETGNPLDVYDAVEAKLILKTYDLL